MGFQSTDLVMMGLILLVAEFNLTLIHPQLEAFLHNHLKCACELKFCNLHCGNI